MTTIHDVVRYHITEAKRCREHIERNGDRCPRAAYEEIATFHDECAAVLHDHLAKGAQEWQPIETAPKDGTTVLLACGDRVTAGDWVSPEMHPTWEGDDFDAHWQSWDGGFHNDGEHAATHWMPLPAAPMLSQRGES